MRIKSKIPGRFAIKIGGKTYILKEGQEIVIFDEDAEKSPAILNLLERGLLEKYQMNDHMKRNIKLVSIRQLVYWEKQGNTMDKEMEIVL